MDTNQNQPGIEARLKKWKSAFTLTSLTACDIDELAGHLKDDYDNLLELGLNENEAWLVATYRIGEPAVLKEEFKKVNHRFTINRNWMILLWGAISVLILQAVFIIVPLVFKNSIPDLFKPSNENSFISKEYYSIGVIIIVSTILIIIRDGRLINRFTNSLARYASLYAIVAMVAGLWAAFFSYIIFANYSGFKYAVRGSEVNSGINFLVFGFYFPLIAITAFSTLRYFSSETVSFNAFNKKMNWIYALALGLLAQTPVQFSHSLPYNDMVRSGIIILISVILFLVIGWMAGQSKNGIINLVAAQLPSMCVWIAGSIVNNDAKLTLFIFYLVTIIALLGGYCWSKYKQTQTYLAT